MKEIYDAIDRRKGEFLDALKDLLRRPSISYTGEGISECAEYLKGLLESWGVVGSNNSHPPFP